MFHLSRARLAISGASIRERPQHPPQPPFCDLHLAASRKTPQPRRCSTPATGRTTQASGVTGCCAVVQPSGPPTRCLAWRLLLWVGANILANREHAEEERERDEVNLLGVVGKHRNIWRRVTGTGGGGGSKRYVRLRGEHVFFSTVQQCACISVHVIATRPFVACLVCQDSTLFRWTAVG